MAYDCEVKELPVQPALSMRLRTPVERLPQELGQAFGVVFSYMQELGEYPAGPPFVAYYNADMQDLDVEAGFPTTKPLPGKGAVESSQAPAGKVASCLHTGPYSDLEPAYTALMSWMAENGYEGTGVGYEVYLNDPDVTPPEALLTQVMFALKS